MSKPAWIEARADGSAWMSVWKRGKHRAAWLYKLKKAEHSVAALCLLAQRKDNNQWEVRIGPRPAAEPWSGQPVVATFESLEEAKAYAEVMVKLEGA